MKLLIDLDEKYINAIDKIKFLVGGRTDRKLQLEIIKAIKNGRSLEQELTTKDYDCISREYLYCRIKGMEHYEESEGSEDDGTLITYNTCDWNEVLREIEDAPSVTPQEPKTKGGINMSREEAIKTIENAKHFAYDGIYEEAFDMAIKALEQETVSKESYDHEYFLRKEFEIKIAKLEHDKNVVLDKIRAEIEQLSTSTCTETRRIYIDADDFKENVLAILDKYKADEEQE